MRTIIVLALLLVCLGLRSPRVSGSEGDPVARIGLPAPEFVLEGIDGKKVRLSRLRGKVVVLEWTNHQCPTVNHYYRKGILPGIVRDFRDKPVAWLAVDSSHFCERVSGDIRKWREQHGQRYPYLLDAPGTVGRLYGAKTTPHMFVIDQKGILVYTGAVDDRHGEVNYVQAAVEALLTGSNIGYQRSRPRGCTVKYGTTTAPATRPSESSSRASARQAPLSPREPRAKTVSSPESVSLFVEAVSVAKDGNSEPALALLEESFRAGYANPGDALKNPQLAALRQESKARARLHQLLRDHAVEFRLTLVDPGEPGESLIIAGTVRNPEGDPLEGVLVYVYHTDARGIYSEEGDSNPRIFGYLKTDSEGRYEYRTIRPAAYPNTKIDQHIHYEIHAPGFPEQTLHLGFADDPWWNDRPYDGAWVIPVSVGRDGAKRGVADIVVKR